MSSIKLTADSGGGTFELKAPSSSGNTRVLTLPDITNGTILTNQTTGLGKVLQVRHKLDENQSSTTSTSYTNTPTSGLNHTITPIAASSKIVMVVHLQLEMSGANVVSMIFARDPAGTPAYFANRQQASNQAPAYTSNEFQGLTNLIKELQNKKTYQKISELINKDLSNSYVRVEVICDREGFWLKPHCDIKEKLMSCLLFVNKHNESEDLGTDFYDNDLKLIKTLPYKDNYGYFFSSGPDTWHGMEKKEIIKERRCLQVNYVTFKTDWKVED